MTTKQLIKDYNDRYEHYEKLIVIEKEFLHTARKNNNEEDKIEHCGNLRRLRELKQMCYQVVKDLELLD